MTGKKGPLVKWVGGKSWLSSQISWYWNQYLNSSRFANGEASGSEDQPRLVEPFCGGLGVTLALKPRRALLNDLNHHLINLYRAVRRGEMGRPTQLSPSYNVNRAEFNNLVVEGLAPTTRGAELFYYLITHSFNGLSRFNQKGQFNSPEGQARVFVPDWSWYSQTFSQWTFQAGDFETIELEDTDFIYADPPYAEAFGGYTPHGFSIGDQVRLAKWLSQHKGLVLASNSAIPEMVDLYTRLGFTVSTVPTSHRFYTRAGRLRPTLELLAYKPFLQ